MEAGDVMTAAVVTVAPETPVPEIARILLKHRISAVPVVDADGRLAGIVSEGDLVHRRETGTERQRSWWIRLLAREELARDYVKAHGARAADVMTRSVVTASENTSLGDLARILEERRIKRLPIVRNGELVGIVSRADLIRGLAVRPPAPAPVAREDRAIRDRLLETLKDQAWAHPALVNIVVERGIVHLWGLVHTVPERDALRVAAESIPGVRGVEDHLGYDPAGMWAE